MFFQWKTQTIQDLSQDYMLTHIFIMCCTLIKESDLCCVKALPDSPKKKRQIFSSMLLEIICRCLGCRWRMKYRMSELCGGSLLGGLSHLVNWNVCNVNFLSDISLPITVLTNGFSFLPHHSLSLKLCLIKYEGASDSKEIKRGRHRYWFVIIFFFFPSCSHSG